MGVRADRSAARFALIGPAVLPRHPVAAGGATSTLGSLFAVILSDAGAGLSTLAIVLLLTNQLESRAFLRNLVHLRADFANAAFGTHNGPLLRPLPLLVSKRNLSGQRFGAAWTSGFEIWPGVGWRLMGIIRRGCDLIDVATFALRSPRYGPTPLPAFCGKGPGKTTLWNDLTLGWRYISARPGLKGLLLFFAVVNFLWGMVGALITPMILSWTSSDELGLIIAVAGAGMFAGSLLMSAWGGPRRRINGVLSFELLSGICFVLMGLRPSFWLVAAGARFGAHVTIAIVLAPTRRSGRPRSRPRSRGGFSPPNRWSPARLPLWPTCWLAPWPIGSSTPCSPSMAHWQVGSARSSAPDRGAASA